MAICLFFPFPFSFLSILPDFTFGNLIVLNRLSSLLFSFLNVDLGATKFEHLLIFFSFLVFYQSKASIGLDLNLMWKGCKDGLAVKHRIIILIIRHKLVEGFRSRVY